MIRRRRDDLSVHRSSERFQTSQPGIETWHCFSARSHYDAANTGFGLLVGFDEHVVAPGAGFPEHAHRGVDILSWVAEGSLRHEDASRTTDLAAGTVQVQRTGSGVRHSEGNASGDQPLRFFQITVLGDDGTPRYTLGTPPALFTSGALAVHRAGPLEVESPLTHLFVAAGRFEVGPYVLGAGDSLRAEVTLSITGDGELLVLALRNA